MTADARALIVHLVYRFDTGGLENGVVKLINHMPVAAYRHAVIALTEVAPGFARRIERDEVALVSLHKPAGHGLKVYPRLLRLLREMQPAVVHTRNLAALEMQPAAWAARVPVRIHGEHGRDVGDIDGSSRHHQRLRRLYSPFVHRYVALSKDLAGYLTDRVGIAPGRVEQIYNGVDAELFAPPPAGPQPIAGAPFGAPGHWLIGTVGRMQTVKHQTLLARAFARALVLQPSLREQVRLLMVGEGPLRPQAQAILAKAGLGDLAWLPGERADVADVMRGMNCFVLPSLAEGISNTILEAMASGLPVIAADVGGNAELVAHGRTGELVPPDDVDAMAHALLRMAADPERAAAMGREGRAEVERRFSLPAMVAAYQALYDRQLSARA